MTEKVLFHDTNGFTGTVGDASAPYTEDEFYDYNHTLWAAGQSNGGILGGITGELLATVNTAGLFDSVDVDAGRAQVRGMHYYNDALVNLPLPLVPAVGDTGGLVYVRDNFGGLNNPPAQYEARLGMKLSADGTATIPTTIQTSGTTYEIPIASFIVDTLGNIWTDTSKTVSGVTDLRHFIIHAGSGMIRLREFVGDGVTGLINWTGIQQDLSHLMIVAEGRDTAATTSTLVKMSINGVAAGYDGYIVRRTTAGAFTATSTVFPYIIGEITGASGAASVSSQFTARINNYTRTAQHSAYSSGVLYNGGGAAMQAYDAYGWFKGTAQAINSLQITGPAWATDSKITLYGLK